jgi:hypothetical protein
MAGHDGKGDCMSAGFDLNEAAARLVADLMPIAVTVSGPGSDAFAKAVNEAGAGAEVFADAQTGFDLAVLLAPRDMTSAAATTLVVALAAASDRVLFVPLPLATTDLPDMDVWFELFAEQGYQPVVEYDATFLGQGAFLVDRNATAAESELASFAERVTLGGALAASTQRVAALEAELGDAGDRAALKNALAERDASLAALRIDLQTTRLRAEKAEAEAATWREQIRAWEIVGQWVANRLAAPQADALTSLRRASGRVPKRRLLQRWRGGKVSPDAVEQRLLEEVELIRASKLFDPVWYIASQPALARDAGDPALHYLLVGADAGADPGPWFSTAEYRENNPGLCGNPLVHAIRNGTADARDANK